MAVNKVQFGDKTLVDLTSDTVSPASLAKGVTAHAANGEIITGMLDASGGSGGAAFPLYDVQTIQSGAFTNAGSGWNSFTFPDSFWDTPALFVTPPTGYVCEVMGLTASGFVYQVKTASPVSFYAASSSGGSANTSYSAEHSAATSDPVTIQWAAIERRDLGV